MSEELKSAQSATKKKKTPKKSVLSSAADGPEFSNVAQLKSPCDPQPLVQSSNF